MLVADEEDGGELVKVVDFGIAKLVGDLDSTLKTALSRTSRGRPVITGSARRGPVLDVTSSGVGTPYYMAPEQVQDSAQVGPATDIWAFGVVAYECLTGRRPFDDESVGKLLVRVLAAGSPTPASSLAPVPALFDDWFRVACAREPGNRFPDVQTAAAELAIALDDRGSSRLRADVTRRLSVDTAAPSRPEWPAGATPVSPLAETLDPPRPEPLELPPRSRAPTVRPLRLLRPLPVLGALAAAGLALALAAHDARWRAPAPIALVRTTVPAPLEPSPLELHSPAPMERAVASSAPPDPPALPSTARPSTPPQRRRPSQALPSAFRLPPLGL